MMARYSIQQLHDITPSPLESTYATCRTIGKGGSISSNKSRHQYGLVSADRNNKATLPLTTPRCTIKSSAKDLSLRIVKLQYTREENRFFHPLTRCESDAIQGPKAYSYTTTMS
jgi:hypothetical protein